MALVLKDRVKETTITTGTGTITLAGASSGFQSFSTIGNANTTYYSIVGGTEWEVGLGTYTSSNTTLSRDTVLESSNGGSLVNFSAGTKDVFVTYPAEKSIYQNASSVANITSLDVTTALGYTPGTVTSVTGTSPVSVATGTTTPVISMAAATTSVNGYLTSTDWTTFNSKAPATSGTSILYGNGSGGFSNVTVGSGLSFITGTLSASGGGGMTYPSGTGIAVVTSGTSWGTTLAAPSGAIVGTTDTQTLSSKTLTTPIISSISNIGTLTLPTSTDTLVGRATTDTLTNKTLTSPTCTGTVVAPIINAGAATALTLQSAGTTALTIDTSQRVAIGGTTVTDVHLLNVQGSAATHNIGVVLNKTNATAQIWGITNSGPLVFYDYTASAERMRITSGGEVYIAGTTDQGAYNLQCNGTGVWGAGAYVNGSDARIKENIVSIDSGLDVVAKLNPVTYKYKESWSKDQSTQTGFIAQELLVALEGKNYVDGIVQQGGEYMSVAYQNIIPILTKAIQEQQTIINDLKARIETLEVK